MTKRAKRTATQKLAKASLAEREKLPLIEHIKELRRRLFYVAACVAVGSGIAYGLERKLIDVLLRPSHGQNFIYTSPLGGMNFLFTVCLDIGLVLATPVIIYQLLAFLQPIMRDTTRKFLLVSSAAAGLVALIGVVFGYFVGLPSALHFLMHQFTTVQVRPLITIQSYMQFVALYLFGSALMFQLPLILLIINRIKPLKPSGLFKYERHLVVGAFIIAFVMNPTPNIMSQLVVVLPIIATYQFGILVIWLVNRGKNPTLIDQLRAEDVQRQAERAARQLSPLVDARPLPAAEPDIAASEPEAAPNMVAVETVESTTVSAPVTSASRQYSARLAGTAQRAYVPLRRQLVQ